MSADRPPAPGKSPRAKITAPAVLDMKRRGRAHRDGDRLRLPVGSLADEAGVDLILVGDSLGTVVLGYDEHAAGDDGGHAASHEGRDPCADVRPWSIADMPFMCYQVSAEQAVPNAGRFVQEGGADAMKLEGGERVAEAIRRIVDAGIPVMGHLGLTPQSVLAFGGYSVQARGEADQERLAREAALLAGGGVLLARARGHSGETGCHGLEVAAHPDDRHRRRARVRRPGTGDARPAGMYVGHHRAFVRRYAELGEGLRDAFARYVADVKARRFPSDAESY